MSELTEERVITLRIRDELGGAFVEECEIRLEVNGNLFRILCAKRAFDGWYLLRSLNIHTSPDLNLNLRVMTGAQAVFLVNRWGDSLFTNLTMRHRLDLTMDPGWRERSRVSVRRSVPAPRPVRGP